VPYSLLSLREKLQKNGMKKLPNALNDSLATFLSADHSHFGMTNSVIFSPFSFFSFCACFWPLPFFILVFFLFI